MRYNVFLVLFLNFLFLIGCNTASLPVDTILEDHVPQAVLSEKFVNSPPIISERGYNLNQVLEDKVLVKHMVTRDTGAEAGVGVQYFYASVAHTCYYFLGHGIGSRTREWREEKDEVYGSLLKFAAHDKTNPTAHDRPWVFENQTGDFYSYIHLRPKAENKQWLKYGPHYLQASWPRWAKDACPDLPIPDDYPINEKQTAVDFDLMEVQDPNARLTGLLSE